MKNSVLTSMFCILSSVLFAQDITISFKSKVDTVLIDSIIVTNLKTAQNVKLIGGESLLLVNTSTILDRLNSNIEMGFIYPNPTDENATFCFSTNKCEEVEIRMYNAHGQLQRLDKQNLPQGTHRYSLKFPLPGIYYLSLLKSDESSGYKVVYTGKKTKNSSILYRGSEKLISLVPGEIRLKDATTDKSLEYTEGDVIQYSFFSGVNTTIVSEIPTVTKTIYVEFVSCIDNDNRSYKVVKIGDQWWMAENLAYLPAVYPPTSGSFTEPQYYVYGYSGNDVATAKQQDSYTTYGVLYNWPAAKTACPQGWHLPSDAEWTAIENYLITNGYNYDGTTTGNKIAKSLAATTNWTADSGTGVIGNDLSLNNKSGFSALPGGYRHAVGDFEYIGNNCFWWVSTEFDANQAKLRTLFFRSNYLGQSSADKEYGFSVRCVKD